MYFFMSFAFIPISEQGRASVRKRCSMTTASLMISVMRSCDGLWTRWLNIRQAKSQWRPWRKKNEKCKFNTLSCLWYYLHLITCLRPGVIDPLNANLDLKGRRTMPSILGHFWFCLEMNTIFPRFCNKLEKSFKGRSNLLGSLTFLSPTS